MKKAISFFILFIMLHTSSLAFYSTIPVWYDGDEITEVNSENN